VTDENDTAMISQSGKVGVFLTFVSLTSFVINNSSDWLKDFARGKTRHYNSILFHARFILIIRA
jgi:hypothetical protein